MPTILVIHGDFHRDFHRDEMNCSVHEAFNVMYYYMEIIRIP